MRPDTDRQMTSASFYSRTIKSWAALLGSFFLTTSALANPVVNNIASGNVSITQTPSTTTVNQASQKAIINWNSFNINQGQHTHFQQPSGGVALNRINPNQGASRIFGQLTATGKIILVNSAGVFIGPNAFINVGGLIASTADITDQNFLNGFYKFDQLSPYAGAIVNQGTIIAADHGLIALMGSGVSNEGLIEANLGKVVIASGEAFTMSFAGNDLISFVVDQGTTQRGVDANGNVLADGVKNTGTIQADGGSILIHAKSAANVLDKAINLEGIVQANSAAVVNGEIIIYANPSELNTVRLAGEIKALGNDINELGGKIDITAHNIMLDHQAILSASGQAGGGSIHVGGSAQDGTAQPTAHAVVVKENAKISADAIQSGKGGEVLLLSDYYTSVFGDSITARGGATGGDGGHIETSSKQTLEVGNTDIDVSAPAGGAGTWLLDPYDLIISADANSPSFSASPFEPSTGTATLNVSTLINALNAGNVIIKTGVGASGNGDIIIATNVSYDSANSLTLSAYRDITSTVSNAVINNSGTGAVILRADNTGTMNGTVKFTGTTPFVNASGGVSIYYNPTVFGTQDTIYSGGTTPTQYMLVHGLGLANDSITSRSLGSLSNQFNGVLWDKNYALASNIDATATQFWNSGSGFRPIGNFNFSSNTGVAFSGKFDGQGFVISNMTINNPDIQSIGMFGKLLAGASVSNLGLTNLNINYFNTASTFDRYIGAIAAYVSSGASLSNVYSTGSITHSGNASNVVMGGIVGANAGNVSLAHTTMTLSATGNASASLFTIGGFAGKNLSGGSITNSSAYGNITIAGTATTKNLGGFAGENAGIITNSLSIGFIDSATGNKGGFVGLNSAGTVNSSYWDKDRSGLNSSGGGTGYFTSQMQNAANFTGWDFATIWNNIPSVAYPYHRFIYSSTPRIISGTAPSATTMNSTVQLASNGTVLFNTQTGADDSFYFFLNNGTLADSTNMLLYLDNASVQSNLVAIAPTSGNSLSGLSMAQDTLSVGGSTSVSHANLTTAKGSLSDVDIFYSTLASDLTMNANKHFATNTGSTYAPEGNVSTSGTGDITLSGTVNLNTNITLTGDVITINGGSAVTGTGGTRNINIVNAGNSTISSALTSNIGTLTKSGSGTLTLSNAGNSFTGDITINAGTLAITSDGALGNTANDLFLNGTTLTSSGNVTLGIGRAITLGTGAVSINSTSGTLAIGGTINGAQALSLGGAGSITLNGVVGGSTALTSISANPALLTFGANITTSGAQSYTSNTALGANTILTGTAISLAAISGSTFNLTINNAAASSISGIYSGSGNLTKSGSGVLTLSASNNYNGTTAVNSGTLILTNAGALGVGNTTVSDGATLEIGFSGVTSDGGVISLAGTGVSNAGALNFSSAGTLNNATITLTGNTTINTSTGITGTINSAVGGTFMLSKTGGGTLTLGGSSSYSSGTSLTAGTILAAHNSALGSGTLTFANGGSGTLAFSGNRIMNNPVAFSGNGIVDINNTASELSGAFSGSGGLTINNTGGNNNANTYLQISNNNTGFSGQTTLNAGTLSIGHNGAFGTGTLVINGGNLRAGGAARTISNNITVDGNFILGRLTTLSGTLTLTGNRTIYLGNPDSDTNTLATISGVIQESGGARSLTIDTGTAGGTSFGTGIQPLVLSGANTYSGGTIINNNAYVRSSHNSGLGTGSVAVLSGGTLEISNNITATNTMTINGSGYSGMSPTGALRFLSGNNTLSGNLTLNSDAVISNISGTQSLNGSINGANALTLSGTGTKFIVNGTVGDSTPLASLTASIPLDIFNSINTTNNQTYNNAITLGATKAFTSTSGTINVANTLNGGFGLTLSAANVTFGGILGGSTPLTSLTVTGTTAINTTAITTSGAQLYNSNITLGANLALSSNSLTFMGTVDGANTLTLSGSGTATINGAIGAITPLAGFTSIVSTILNNNISTSGAQTFNAISFGGTNNVTLTTTNTSTGDIILNNGITWSGTNTFALNAGRFINFNNAAISGVNGSLTLSTIVPSASLTASSYSNIGTIDVNNFNLIKGAWFQQSASLPNFIVRNNFQLNSGSGPNSNVQFMRAANASLTNFGAAANPVLINDVYGLQGIGSNSTTMASTVYYNLGANIDASTVQNWNNGSGFVPIGNSTTAFSGIFNGQNNTITNLYINRASTDYIGLFGYSNSTSTFSNLGLINSQITGRSNVGSFAGYISGTGTFSNIYSTNLNVSGGTAGGTSLVGGLIGIIVGPAASNLYATGNVTGTGNYLGGLIGSVHSNVSTSWSGVDVNTSSGSYVGSFAGDIGSSKSITNAYSIGSVSGTNQIGGFIGEIQNGTSLLRVYSTGKVTGTTNTGGLVGRNNNGGGGGITNSFWDTTTSGITTSTQGCGNVTCSGAIAKTTAELMDYTNTFATPWSGFITGSSSASLPVTPWFMLDGGTRPILLMEYSTTIKNAHQLQLMSAATNASYTLGTNIDLNAAMSNAADVWGTNKNTLTGAGFVPISNLTNTFNGNNNYIDNLYIYLPNSGSVGLFNTISANASNIGLKNINITGNNYTGGFAGTNNFATLTNIYTTGVITITGGGDNNSGGIIGRNWGTLTNVFNTANINALVSTARIGGIAGTNLGTIQNSYNAGNVTVAGGGSIGGIVGENIGPPQFGPGFGYVLNSYNTGNVSVYAPTDNAIGGLIGYHYSNIASTVDYTYSSGAVYAPGVTAGGLIGQNVGASAITSRNFWDTQTSGLSTSQGGVGKTTAELMTKSTYTSAGWTNNTVITSTASTNGTKPAATWFIFDNNSRPLLMMEQSNTITNAHQLQLMGSTLGGSYTLANDIDLKSGMNNAADIWGTNQQTGLGKGFVPIGYSNLSQTVSNNEFSGSLNGQGYVIDNLYINKPTNINTVGLFGALQGNATIQNLSITNANITGTSVTGILAGNVIGNSGTKSISNIYVSGQVQSSSSGGYNGIGGMIGVIYLTIGGSLTISNAYSTANVYNQGSLTTGGFIGYSRANSPAAAIINNTYSTGLVTGTSGNIGGFAGHIDQGTTINNSFWDTVSSNRANGYGVKSGAATVNNLLGGCFGNSAGCALQPTNASNNGAAVDLALLSTYTNAGWNTTAGLSGSITATPSISATAPNYTWFIFDGMSRPMLLTEWKSNIKSAHQLQLMGAALDADYSQGNHIDLASPLSTASEVWGTNPLSGTAGFISIGNNNFDNTVDGTEFTGTFNGNGYSIDHLYIYRPTSTKSVGLFGAIAGTASVKNVSLTHTNITGGNVTGGLVGSVIGTGIKMFDNIYVAGDINGINAGSYHGVGGIVGVIDGSGNTRITNAYSTASLSSTGNANTGGFAGYMNNSNAAIQYTYSSGAVSTSTANNVGGFIGVLTAGAINNSLWDIMTSGQAAGYGSIGGSGTINNFKGGCFGPTCSVQPTNASNNGAAVDLSKLATYTAAGWSSTLGTSGSITATPSATRFKPAYSWYIFDNNTRPLLLSEWSESISTPHQLQLMGAARDGNYTMQNNIDLNDGSMTDASEIWATNRNTNTGTGFMTVGAYETGAFVGNFYGNNYTISNLYLNRSNSDTTTIGLFGEVNGLSDPTVIENITLANLHINYVNFNASGAQLFLHVGGLAGTLGTGATLRNAFTSGTIEAAGNFQIIRSGGMVGTVYGGIIRNSGSSADLNLSGPFSGAPVWYLIAGGFAGALFNPAAIYDSYSTGNVFVMNNASVRWAGGFIGEMGPNTNIARVYSSGTATVPVSYGPGSGSFAGGLIGSGCGASCATTDSFWDMDASGLTTSIAGVGKTTAQLMDITTFTNAGWDITSTPSTTAIRPANNWFIFEGNTRPALLSEWSSTIYSPTQLQLMGSTLGAQYKLANNIDLFASMNNPSALWNSNQILSLGKGFTPIGTQANPFSGSLDGQGYFISNLYMNRTAGPLGFFGVTSSTAEIQNFGISNANFTYNNPASNVAVQAGILIGSSGSNSLIRNVFATGEIAFLGNFDAGRVGGLVGTNAARIENAYSGVNMNVTGTTNANSMIVGGMVGLNLGSGNISNSYSTGSLIINGVANTKSIGGFAGENQATISNSYSSGSIISIAGNVGGFLGLATSGSLSGNFWDKDSSRYDTSAGGANVVGKSTVELMTKSTFSNQGWAIESTPSISTTTPSTNWFIFEGSTRPMLLSEWSSTIATPHQLQLMGSTLGASYTLINPLDMYTAMHDVSDVWGTNQSRNVGSGFVAIGTSTTPFSGTMEGQQFAINHLYMNRIDNPVGLFGYTSTTSTIQNLGVINADLRYNNINSSADVYAGMLVGSSGAGSLLKNNFMTGSLSVTGNFNNGYIGGFVGNNAAIIQNSYASVSVTVTANPSIGNLFAGGFIGRHYSSGAISNAYSLGAVSVSGTATNKYIGGFVGQNQATITNAYSTGATTNAGTSANIGGFAGAHSGTITNSFWDKETSTLTSSAGSTNVAGYKGMLTSEMTKITKFTASVSGFVTSDNAWDMTAYASLTGLPPTNTWFILNNETRPMLMAEWSKNISTPHQLQMMQAALNANYSLTNDIDLTAGMNNKAEIWATNQAQSSGNGFLPVGVIVLVYPLPEQTFTGSFRGNYHTINNLYINRANLDGVGLFGGSSPSTGRVFNNVALTNVDITGFGHAGALIGWSRNAWVSNVSATGKLSSGNGGYGDNVSNGGLLGYYEGGILDASYSGVNVTSNSAWVGGMIGFTGGSIVKNSYTTGSVTSANGWSIGSFTGYSNNSISNSYASGALIVSNAVNQNAGGFVGYLGGGSYANNFFDTNATGISYAAGNQTTPAGITAGCFLGTGCLGGSANLSAASTFSAAGWNITNQPSSTATKPAGQWFIFEGNSRPMLLSEWNKTITTPHQLQMMGSTLGASYTLGANFDMSTFFNSVYSQSEIWGTKSSSNIGKGFIPIGTTSNPFIGNLDGQHYAINNLYINRGTEDAIGLFGVTDTPSVIRDIKLTNASITYTGESISEANVGTIVGKALASTTLINVIASGSMTVSGTADTTILRIGGLVGGLYGRLLDSFTDIPITLTATNIPTVTVGGLAGKIFSGGNIEESYSLGNTIASGTATNKIFGGIAGVNDGSLLNTYSIRSIDSTISSSTIGGLAGTASGTATSSFWDNQTTGIPTSASGVGKTTAEMFTASTFSAWDLVNTWGIIDGQSYPYFRELYPSAPRIVSGTTTAGGNASINLVANGTQVGTVKTGASGFYYFLLPSSSIADSANLLAYIDNASTKGNTIGIAPINGGSLSGTTSGLNIIANAVTAGSNGTMTLSNALLGAAKGVSIVDTDILYSYNSGTGLLSIGGVSTALTNTNFITGSGTTYNVANNISLLGTGTTSATFNGSTNFTGSSLTLSGAGTTSFIFNNPVTVSTPTLNLTANTTFNGALTLSGATLNITGNNTVAGLTTLTNSTMGISGTGQFAAASLTNSTLNVTGNATFTGHTALASTSTLALSGTGTFNTTNFSGSTVNITGTSLFNGASSISGTTVTLTGNSTFGSSLDLLSAAHINAAGDTTFSTLNLSGAATLSLTNAAKTGTFNGVTTLAGTTTALTIAGTRLFNQAININSGATLTLQGSGTTTFSNATPISINGTGSNMTLSGSGTFNYVNGVTPALSIAAGGTASITGAATVLGITTIDNGTLQVTGNSSFAALNLLNGAQLNLANSGSVNAFNGATTLSGTTTAMTVAGSRSFSNTVSVSSGATLALQGSSATTFSNTASVSGTGSSMTMGGNATFNLVDSIIPALSVNTGGTVNITGTSTVAGITTLQNGTLNITGNSTFAALNVLGGGDLNLTNSGSTNTFNGITTLSDSGSTMTVAGSRTFGNNLSIQSGATLALQGSSSTTFNGATSVSGTGSALTVAGNSIFGYVHASTPALSVSAGGSSTLSGAATILGITSLNNGTLNIVGNSAFDTLNVSGGAQLNLTNSGSVNAFNNLTTLTGSNTTMTVAGSRSFSNDVNINSGATLILQGNNASTFSGNTTINNGTLTTGSHTTFNGTATFTAATTTINGNGIFSNATNLSGSTLTILGNATFNTLGATSGSHVAVSGTSAFNNNLTFTGSTAALAGHVTFNVPVSLSGSTVSLSGSGTFNNTLAMTNANLTLGGAGIFNAASTIDNSSLAVGNNGIFNDNVTLSGNTVTLSGTHANNNTFIFNNPVDITATNLTLNANGANHNSFTFHDTVNNSANITLSGTGASTRNIVFNDILTLTNHSNMKVTASGTSTIDFTKGILGEKNLSLYGEGAGTHNFILGAGIALNNLDVSASANTSNNLFSINTNLFREIWNITGTNTGNMSGILSILNPVTFSNIQNITGGNRGNRFIFTNAGRMSGVIDGRNPDFNTVINRLDFYNLRSQLDMNFSSTVTGTGFISNRDLGLIARFHNINDIIHTPFVSNGTIKLTNKPNYVVITGANAGYINDPIYFSNFQKLVSLSGQDQVKFETFSLLNTTTGQSIMANSTMNFEGFNASDFSGTISKTEAVADVVNQFTETDINNWNKLVVSYNESITSGTKSYQTLIDDLLDQTIVAKDGACVKQE